MKKKSAPPPRSAPSESVKPAGWTFLTNHTHVLLCLTRDPAIRLRDVAELVGITERMVQKIVAELVAAGFVDVEKQGRCNTYRLHLSRRLRHPLEAHHSVGEILELLKRD
jgi:DNA-binding MarR family transcriptional regulator